MTTTTMMESVRRECLIINMMASSERNEKRWTRRPARGFALHHTLVQTSSWPMDGRGPVSQKKAAGEKKGCFTIRIMMKQWPVVPNWYNKVRFFKLLMLF